jgi:hypothetical protein
MKQPHSWMEYRYCNSNDNEPYKMWICDDHRIFQTATGYIAANENGEVGNNYTSFDDARAALVQ